MKELCYAAVFVVESIISWLYFEYLYPRKTPVLQTFSCFLVGYAFLFGLGHFYIVAINAAAFLVINTLLAWICYQCTPKTAVLHSGFLTFIMLLAEIAVTMFGGLFDVEFTAYTYDITVLVINAVASKFLYLVLALLCSRLFFPRREHHAEPRLMALFCALPVISTAFAIWIIYQCSSFVITDATERVMMLSASVLMVVNLLFLILYNYQQKLNEENTALQLSQQKELTDKEYYQALQKQYEEQRILVHDIRHHLQALSDMASGDNTSPIKSYISQIVPTLTPERHVKLCNNPTLNMLLLRFRDSARKQGIEFYCDVREGSLSFLESDAVSLTALFSNLLSNAVEAAVQSKEKIIEIRVIKNEEQAICVLSVINSCDVTPTVCGSGFLTHKSDKTLHGVGLRSISRIVRQYHGLSGMRYDKNTHRFHHVIQFPIE